MDRNETIEALMLLKYCLSSDEFVKGYWNDIGNISQNNIDIYNQYLQRVLAHFHNKQMETASSTDMLEFVDNMLSSLDWETYDDWQDDVLKAL